MEYFSAIKKEYTMDTSKSPIGQVQWLKPIIPALWEARQVDCLRSGVRDQSDQHGVRLYLKKKNAKNQLGVVAGTSNSSYLGG